MDKDLLNILQSKETPVNDQQIIEYLEGTLDAQTRHKLEEQELEDELMQDAMEGLQSVADASKLESITREMNNALQKKLVVKNKRKEKRKWKDQDWITIAIITVLLLVTISYLVIKFIYKKG